MQSSSSSNIMATCERDIRHGFGGVRPYLYGNAGLPNFVCHVFGAVEIERVRDETEVVSCPKSKSATL
jgi:hypothetical protein